MDAFIENTNDGRQMGYEGRMLIHRGGRARPQGGPVFEEEGLAKGRAAVPYEGMMVDTPVYVNVRGDCPL